MFIIQATGVDHEWSSLLCKVDYGSGFNLACRVYNVMNVPESPKRSSLLRKVIIYSIDSFMVLANDLLDR